MYHYYDDDVPRNVEHGSNHSPSEPALYPDFVLDGWGMYQLARSCLEDAIEMFCHTFYTGCCHNDIGYYCLGRFEEVAEHLGCEKRQRLVNVVDAGRSRQDGDKWQAFKYACMPGFWSTPADLDAILRVAGSVLDDLPQHLEQFGPDFLDTLREVRQQQRSSDSVSREP